MDADYSLPPVERLPAGYIVDEQKFAHPWLAALT